MPPSSQQRASDSPRVGVFVCDCGTNIAGVVDVPAVAEYARSLEGVVFVDEGKWICSVDYLTKLKEFIAEHELNRVVVACCTSRTHEPTFKDTVKEGKLNPFLLEFVSIREQSSWVHRTDPAAATQKAKELVRMGVAKALLLEEAEQLRVPVGKDCLVIGGGIAGMSAALAVADHGFSVHLVEKTDRLGGLLNRLSSIAPEDLPPDEIVLPKLAQIEKHPNIRVHVGTQVEGLSGYVGNYKVTLKENGSGRELAISTIIVATGMEELEPEGKFGYGRHPGVMTQLQLEEKLREETLGDVSSVAIINCVNSRNEERGCCNIGCLASLKSARAITRLNSRASVAIFYRDLCLEGTEVNYLHEKLPEGDIKLIRFAEGREPQVEEKDGRLVVRARDILLGKDLEVASELVVLTTALKGDRTADRLKGLLKVSANEDDFFQEAHIKLRPLDFASDGIYLCGCARSPKNVRESIEEALGAAMRAAIPMGRGYVESEGIVADLDLAKCRQCGLCARECPFGAIELQEVAAPAIDEAGIEKEAGQKPAFVPRVIKAICKGCGTCAANCPEEAISIVHYTDEQILAQIEAGLAENPDRKLIAFCCHWCALGAVDLAGVSRLEYPHNIRIVRLMCSGRVSEKFVTRAFELGAAGVLVAGCEFPTCHYLTGNYKCQKKLERLRKKMAGKGFDDSRLWTVWLSAASGPKFVKTVKDMVKALKLDQGDSNAEDHGEALE